MKAQPVLRPYNPKLRAGPCYETSKWLRLHDSSLHEVESKFLVSPLGYLDPKNMQNNGLYGYYYGLGRLFYTLLGFR